ncbi:sensor histidine kinase [Falsigemmobacter faecalis]|uniref:histidine kinase n=1 Tax=Falsigemmobacter faecalis TaxID=2488730 RepID=A0A3P3DG15_9RHOB|nr:PAS domain S-box protein [Falsigemmobacter faecalis]RRH73210.1 PAS domain S-box protein [Falsigemmobacter faecalis]
MTIIKASQILSAFMRADHPPPGRAKPFAEWSAALKSVLTISLASEAQICFFAGPEFLAFYNDAYAPTIGAKHPRALGRPASESWSELWDDLEGLLTHVRRSGETISEKDRRFYIERHGYPETVYFDISFSPVRGCDGTIEAVLCIVSETTSRVEALRTLRENESRMRAVLSGVAAGLCTVSEDGTIVTLNRHFADMLAETPHNLTGRNLREVIDPRDWQDAWLNPQREGEVTELRYRRSDGRTIWVSQSLSIVEDSREPSGRAFCLLTSDITQRRRKETELRRLAAIIEGSDDAILAMDLNMVITSWNSGAERLYGWRAGEVIGTSVLRLLPEGRGDEESRIIERIREGFRIEPYDTTRLCSDGREIAVELTVSPIFDEAGEIVGASKISRDISARIEAARLREFLLFEMKHRVKNILATVLALARQTLGKHDLPDYEVFTKRVYALSRSQDLLTRQGQGSVSAAALIAEVLDPFQTERFTIEGPPMALPGEAVLSVTLALHELVTNALKYGALSVPEGRVEIRWQITEGVAGSAPKVRLTWKERGGPGVVRPARRGFGSVLIRDLLASTLQADISLSFPPEGVEFSAEFLLRGPREDSEARSRLCA